MEWYLKVLGQYTDFNGRARRKEYWMFSLFNLLFIFAAMILDNLLGITFGFGYGPIYCLAASCVSFKPCQINMELVLEKKHATPH